MSHESSSGFYYGELVRKYSSSETYEYNGTCGPYFKIRNFHTMDVEWTVEDLLPIWGENAKLIHSRTGSGHLLKETEI